MERRENEHQLKDLKTLSSSDYEITEGQSDISGWDVLNSAGQKIGTVRDLLFDEDERKIRYFILNLKGNVWDLPVREVLIPIGVAELDAARDFVFLPNITAQQITVLPDYDEATVTISADSELYGHKDFDEANIYARRQSGSYAEHLPYQVITRVYQEENEAEAAFVLLLNNGFTEEDLKVTPYNPINSVTDLQGNTNTEFIGDGSRDEYILSITANTPELALVAARLIEA
jgi:hypothetical protein